MNGNSPVTENPETGTKLLEAVRTELPEIGNGKLKLPAEKAEKPAKSFHLGIAEKCGDKIIGDIWVYRIENDRMAQVALRLSKDVHGRGYGTESLSAMTGFCFEHTELRRLWTEVDVRNIASCRVLEKCGYTREGSIRQGKMVNTWCDYYIYRILASDL